MTLCFPTSDLGPLWTIWVRFERADGLACGCGWGVRAEPALDTWELPGQLCADFAVEPECVAVAAEWREEPYGLTGPALDIVTVPEPNGLVAGLVLCALLGRRSERSRRC